MFFRSSSHAAKKVDGKNICPNPGLVFMAGPRTLHIFAFKGEAAPVKTTKLYQAPFFNVWSDGKVCSGNATLPEEDQRNDRDAWERFFFGSHFTHPNFSQKDRLTLGVEPCAFWQKQLNRPTKTFPESALVDINLTVNDLLALDFYERPHVRAPRRILMNNMDKAILNAFPLVAVPTSEPLQGHTQCGTRYLVGKAGLMREITLPWIRLVHPVATCDADITLPYGAVESSVELWCSEVPAELIRQFTADARQALPNEIAAALIWNSTVDEWRYAIRRSLRATPGYVSFEEIRLEDDEHLVVDIHSHGTARAFFSSTE